jgi:hypothetical protein
MSTLTDRLTAMPAMPAVTQKPRRVSIASMAAVAMAVALAAGLTYKISQNTFAPSFAKYVLHRIGTDLRGLDERWLNARKLIGVRRSATSGRVECVGDYDPYWEAREIADRIESGSRVIMGCLQVRIAGE